MFVVSLCRGDMMKQMSVLEFMKTSQVHGESRERPSFLKRNAVPLAAGAGLTGGVVLGESNAAARAKRLIARTRRSRIGTGKF